MGVFMQAALIPKADISAVRTDITALQQENPDWKLTAAQCICSAVKEGVMVLFNDDFCGYESAAAQLSLKTALPLLLVYIYDGDFWGYYFYQNGNKLDEFCTMPDYFVEDEEEADAEKMGDASVLAAYFGVAAADIQNYLVAWTDEMLDGETEENAYAEDEAAYGDCWQAADFMRRLGYPYADEPAGQKAEEEAVHADMAVNINHVPPKRMDSQPTSKKTPPSLVSGILHNQDISVEDLPNAFDSAYIHTILQKDTKAIFRLTEIGQYRQAADALTEKITENPNDWKLYILRAYCYQALAKKVEMERDLSSALTLDPNNVMVLRKRCPVAATTNRYRRHIEDFTKLMALDPKHYNLYLLSRAWRYYWTDNKEAAQADMAELIARGMKHNMDFDCLLEKLGMETEDEN